MRKDDSVDTWMDENDKQEDTKKESILKKIFMREDTKTEESKGSLIKKIGVPNLCILLVLGIVLVFLCCNPQVDEGKKTQTKKSMQAKADTLSDNPIYADTKDENSEYIEKLENKLKSKLSKVNGIGEVEVMITLQESKELVTLKDNPYTKENTNEKDSQGGTRQNEKVTREDTTILSGDGNGETAPYIIKEIQPKIEGVLVIAQGVGDPSVSLNVVEAVEALFDLPVHKIKVVEMGDKK